jgi:hypothetical protein
MPEAVKKGKTWSWPMGSNLGHGGNAVLYEADNYLWTLTVKAPCGATCMQQTYNGVWGSIHLDNFLKSLEVTGVPRFQGTWSAQGKTPVPMKPPEEEAAREAHAG